MKNKITVFALSSSVELAQDICDNLGCEMGKSKVHHFADGEILVEIDESVRGKDVFIVQSTSNPVTENLMEILVLADALKRASAGEITAIMPYFGYARQDRKAKPRQPITSKLVANMLVEAGATRLLTLDLHTVQVQGFFDIPVDNLFTMPLFAHYYRQQALVGEEIVIVSPKNSGVQRARSLSEYLDATLAIVDHEEIDGVRQEGYVIGNVAGKKCILVDDILNTGQTLATAAEVLMKNGAQEVYACASHGLLSEGAKATLENAPIKEISITDSVYTTTDRQPATLNIISCAELMGEALLRIHENKPMSPLFRLEPKGE